MLRIALLALVFCAARYACASTLDDVKAARVLPCGVITEIADETKDDTHGDLSVLGGDVCRAVGAAILGGGGRVAVHAYPTAALGYEALRHGDIALMVGDTPSAGIARRYGVAFLTPVYFDGQGLLVHQDRGIASFRDLAGKPVCFIGTTDPELRLHQAEARAGVKVNPFPFEEIGEMEAALVGGRCAAMTYDVSRLAADRTLFHGMIRDFVILPDRLTLDPFAPVVRDGDPQWARIVDGVFFALVQAEELGVTRATVVARRGDADETVQVLLGVRRGSGWGLGLGDDWAAQAIAAVGNYGEMLARDTGDGSPLRLDRGVNALGGLIWAPPVR